MKRLADFQSPASSADINAEADRIRCHGLAAAGVARLIFDAGSPADGKGAIVDRPAGLVFEDVILGPPALLQRVHASHQVIGKEAIGVGAGLCLQQDDTPIG